MTGLARLASRPIVAIVAVTALAAFVRFTHLSHPDRLVFDENYYPKAGCILVGLDDETCRLDDTEQLFREQRWDVGSYVHPDLGKWQIGLGIEAFGMTSFGWRSASALAGTLVVLLSTVIAWLVFRRIVWTYVAGVFLALDGLNIAMSRTALLDVHLELWVVLGFLFLVLDRRWLERRETPLEVARPAVSPVWRPWRFAAGVALGAAVAVKWSGAFAILGAVVLSYAWETSRRRRGDLTGWQAFGRAVLRESFGLVLAFAIVPLIVYVATWLPWMHHFGHDLFHDPVAAMAAWWREQLDMWRYHGETLQEFSENGSGALTPTHPYYSRPWRWPILARPVLFYSETGGPTVEQVLAIGNPAIAWASVLAMPYLAFTWRKLRDWRSGFLLVPFLAQWLPWFLVDRPQFSFYLLPMTPFLTLGVVYLLWKLSEARIVVRDSETGDVARHPETGEPAVSRARPYLPFVIAFVVAAIILAIWFWPIVSAVRISDARWRSIVWFRAWM